MLRGVHHAGITVADMDRTLAFYRDILGLTVFRDMIRSGPTLAGIVGYPNARIRIAYCGVPGDTAGVELLQYLEPTGEGIGGETNRPASGHVCFAVDDADEIFQRIVEAGFQPRSEAPVQVTEGPNTGAKAFYVRDPDGFTVEFIQRPSGS